MTIETGGRAFPMNPMNTNEGMTLRDYFAAKAMQAMMSNSDSLRTIQKIIETGEGDENFVANTAYGIADLMLEARK